MASKNGDERMDGGGDVLRSLLAPEELGDALGRHAVPERDEQDLEHLFWARASKIPGTKRAPTVLDRERSEEPDHKAAGGSCFSLDRHRSVVVRSEGVALHRSAGDGASIAQSTHRCDSVPPPSLGRDPTTQRSDPACAGRKENTMKMLSKRRFLVAAV